MLAILARVRSLPLSLPELEQSTVDPHSCFSASLPAKVRTQHGLKIVYCLFINIIFPYATFYFSTATWLKHCSRSRRLFYGLAPTLINDKTTKGKRNRSEMSIEN